MKMKMDTITIFIFVVFLEFGFQYQTLSAKANTELLESGALDDAHTLVEGHLTSFRSFRDILEELSLELRIEFQVSATIRPDRIII